MRFSPVLALASLVAVVSAAASSLETRASAKVFKSCTKPKQVALTFDDGPYIYDHTLLETLAKYSARATFFINGNNWRCAYEDTSVQHIQELYAAGHEFGSHTWSHANMTALTWDKMHSEMWKVEQLLIRILGVNPALFRAPYGSTDGRVLSAVGARNQTMVLWDFDTQDTLGLTAAQSKALYDEHVAKKPASILALHHNIKESTVMEVIPHALEVLSKAGYKFVTVSECLGIPAYQSKVAASKKDASWKC